MQPMNCIGKCFMRHESSVWSVCRYLIRVMPHSLIDDHDKGKIIGGHINACDRPSV